MFIKNLNDLNIYKKALYLSSEVTGLVRAIPHYWSLPESNQIFRSSSSVHANIAEGFAQRFYTQKFIHYLYITLASSDETANHLRKLLLGGHLKNDEGNAIIKNYKDLSIRILNFINYLRKK